MTLRQTTTAEYERRLLRAQQLLEQRLDDPVDPATLARAAFFSLHHFHRIFRAQMGETVMQHVRRLRLERAARKLRNSDVPLLDLALEAGYDSHEAFTRAFLARFGMPPSHYREQPPARLSAWQRQSAALPSIAVAVETYPAQRVAFMRQRGSYAHIGALWQRFIAWAAERGLLGPQQKLFGLCPDDPDVTDEALLRFDACVAVADGFAGDGAVGTASIPAGTYAVGVHRGPYDRLHETYLDVIGRWFPASGCEPAADAVVEHYLNDPACVPASELLTEVRVRIAE